MINDFNFRYMRNNPGVLAPEDFSVSNLPPERIYSRLFVCFLFCYICMRNRLRFTDSKHCFADDE